METEDYALAAFIVGNGVHSDTLHDECNADTFAAKFLGATITYDAGDVITNVIFGFSSALTAGEKTDLDDLVAAHDGLVTIYERKVTVQILHGEKICTAVDPVWMEMGSTVGTPEDEVPDLAKAVGRFVADYKTSGPNCKVRFIEEKDGAANVTLKMATMPDTEGVYKRDASVDTDPDTTPFRNGRNRFIIEMQRPDAGTTASLRDINLHLLRKN